MSLPSFKLSKAGGKWWADGKMPSGRPFHLDCGPASSSSDRAEGVAEQKVAQLVRVSNAGKARWAGGARAREKQRRAAVTSTSSVASSSPVIPEELEQLEELGGTTEAPPASSPAPAATPRQSNEEIRAKLLHLGDAGDGSSSSSSSEVHPDEVLPPGHPRADPEEPVDDEAGEAIADILATMGTTGLVWLANRPLRKKNPPHQGEANEKGLEWFQRGAAYNIQKIVGNKTTMTPTQKMFAGAIIIVGSVWMNAEPIPSAERAREPAAAAPAAATPPAATGEASPAAHANGQTPASSPATSTALTVTGALGTFGVEKRTAN